MSLSSGSLTLESSPRKRSSNSSVEAPKAPRGLTGLRGEGFSNRPIIALVSFIQKYAVVLTLLQTSSQCRVESCSPQLIRNLLIIFKICVIDLIPIIPDHASSPYDPLSQTPLV